MAADSRGILARQNRPSTTSEKSPSPSSTDKPIDTFNYSASPENANALPGTTTNTAGGPPRDAKIIDAFKTIKLRDFKEVHTKPCARESLLTGIGAGFGVGGIRAIFGG